MKESKLIKEIKDWLEEQGCLVWKYHGSVYGIKGFPDLFGMLPHVPIFFAIEVKVPGNKPTPVQNKVLTQITSHGGVAFWADSLETVKTELSPYI